MKKILITLVAIIVLGTSTVFGATFSDTEGHWAENVVEEMASKGILNGFGDGTFKPDESVTREQLITILSRYAKIIEKEKMSSIKNNLTNFDDMNKIDSYAIVAFKWGVKKE